MLGGTPEKGCGTSTRDPEVVPQILVALVVGSVGKVEVEAERMRGEWLEWGNKGASTSAEIWWTPLMMSRRKAGGWCRG